MQAMTIAVVAAIIGAGAFAFATGLDRLAYPETRDRAIPARAVATERVTPQQQIIRQAPVTQTATRPDPQPDVLAPASLVPQVRDDQSLLPVVSGPDALGLLGATDARASLLPAWPSPSPASHGPLLTLDAAPPTRRYDFQDVPLIGVYR